MQETWVRSPSWEDPLEEETATHSSILAWKTPRTEEPGGLQAMGSQRVSHLWATENECLIHVHSRCSIWQKSLCWGDYIVCIDLIVFVYLSIDGSWSCFFLLLLIMLQWTPECRWFFKTLLSIHLAVYPEVGSRDRMLVLFLIFWGISILFSITGVPFYIPTNSALELAWRGDLFGFHNPGSCNRHLVGRGH